MNDALPRRIMAWCQEDPDLRAEVMQPARGSHFSARIATPNGECQVHVPSSGIDRVAVVRTVVPDAAQQQAMIKAGLDARAMNNNVEGMLAARSSLLSCRVAARDGQMGFRLMHPVYADGFTRHTFMAALTEVNRFSTLLDLMLGGLVSPSELERQTDQALHQVDRVLQEPAVASKCASCGATVPAGQAFCMNCGAPAN
jgi:hypothetical protein